MTIITKEQGLNKGVMLIIIITIKHTIVNNTVKSEIIFKINHNCFF